MTSLSTTVSFICVDANMDSAVILSPASLALNIVYSYGQKDDDEEEEDRVKKGTRNWPGRGKTEREKNDIKHQQPCLILIM